MVSIAAVLILAAQQATGAAVVNPGATTTTTTTADDIPTPTASTTTTTTDDAANATVRIAPSPPARAGGEGRGEGAARAGGEGRGEGEQREAPAPPGPLPAEIPTVPEIPLADALALLDRQNLTLAEARARAEEAAAVSDQARSPLLPSLSAQAAYTRNSDSAVFTMPPPVGRSIVIQPLESFSAAGAVRVPLVVPSAWFEARAARSGARAAGAAAEATRLQLRAGFAQAAHAARAAEEVVLAAAAAVEAAAAHARGAERRVEAGIAPPLDSLTAMTDQVRRESDLVRARAELARARLALGVLLGRADPIRVVVAEPPPDPAVAADAAAGPPAPPLVDEALGRRPELRAQREQVRAAEARVRAGWARLAPQLSATGSAFAADVPYPTGEKDGWRATVDLTWTLFDGGLREGRRREARAELAQARAAAEGQRLAVVQEVSDGVRDVQVADERLRLAETQRRLASDAAESARRSFEAGVASSLDVVDANDRLFQADVGLADARARLAQARLALGRALGRG